MKFSTVAISAAAVAGASAAYTNVTLSDVTVTKVVTALTTYCPEPTTLVHGNKTYTVTAPTTLTITDCPCTLTSVIPGTSKPVASGSAHNNGTHASSGIEQGSGASKGVASVALAGMVAAAAYLL
ncbi:hypothetical protein NADFUDRAFT_53252 [Nadsonia fulvescens var. elongata DSM 6958]|uniref:Clock-controlled protein 6 n=1 Tax=Nadsonia fulvescens var. elongata DSM 6958 TaxID=857566 RepID=A0A1E3PDS0_9ASCO|nr:hypothetical protein NADFUDRAFT_53252 [Nadsonia fulvescens var. elongata DSM 6958]